MKKLCQEGIEFFNQGKFQGSLQNFEKALELDPKELGLWIGVFYGRFQLPFKHSKNVVILLHTSLQKDL
ncbi:MAG: tetratricopeptide repeat protein [Nitrospinae bacterium]|nr:tetratricopeptide repeat protein [Nitrospinota bacterium]